MKICTLCKNSLPLSQFNKKTSAGDGLQPQCRDCSRISFRRYYLANQDRHKQVVNENRKKYRARNLANLVELKRKLGCALCSEREICCLEFHHLIPGEKSFSIGTAIGGAKISWEVIENEIEKCVCLCSNCHKKVHAGVLTVDQNVLLPSLA